jgi:hypothetical protein
MGIGEGTEGGRCKVLDLVPRRKGKGFLRVSPGHLLLLFAQTLTECGGRGVGMRI